MNHDFYEGTSLSEETKQLGMSHIARLKAELKKSKSTVKKKVDSLKTHCSDHRYSRAFQIQSKRALIHR